MSTAMLSTELDRTTRPLRRTGILARILRNPMGTASLIVLTLIVLAAILAPLITVNPPGRADIGMVNAPPFTDGYLLGGDNAGRDVLSRLVFGAQLTLLGALSTVIVSLLLGVTLGLIGGYYRGRFDAVAGWVCDLLLILPSKIVLVAMFAVIGPNTMLTMAVLGVMVAPSFYRLVRNLVIAVRKELYIDAAQVSGLSDARIIGRHVLFAVRAPIVVHTSMIAGLAIILQAGLEFLGLGDPDSPTWGGMLQDAFTSIYSDPLLMVWPGIAIGVTVGAFILLGNVVRDSFDAPAAVRPRRRAVAAGSDAVTAPEGSICHVSGLTIGYAQASGDDKVVVDGVGFDVQRGRVLGLVGESGSGKTQTSLAILGLLPKGGAVLGGGISFEGKDLLAPGAARALRGRRIAYIPQEPMSNLDPNFTIGHQLIEPLRAAKGLSRTEAREAASALLERVGIPDVERVLRSYPHQISGGMAQRVLIAGAVSCDPDLIIADEPTTALDVTVQAEILDLLRGLQRERGMSMVLVTHDFGVVADLCDDVVVMRDGRVIERGTAEEIFGDPQQEYTRTLLASTLDGTPARSVLDKKGAQS
jgi:peptide/nickel transport system permease protein